jgi:hypothetical protein
MLPNRAASWRVESAAGTEARPTKILLEFYSGAGVFARLRASAAGTEARPTKNLLEFCSGAGVFARLRA